MSVKETAEGLWGAFSPQAQPRYCDYALKFHEWAEKLCASASVAMQQDNVSAAVTVNTCKLLLQDKWHEWRAVAPKAHRNRTGEGHICLWHCYIEAYRTLRAIELALTPPLLVRPQAPPPRMKRALSIADVVSFGPVSSEEPYLE